MLHTLQNQQLFGHPRLVIVYPSRTYRPGTNSPPGSLYAGPPTFTGATISHSRASFSAVGMSHEKETLTCTSSASSKNVGPLPTMERASFGVALVRRGNTRINFKVNPMSNQTIQTGAEIAPLIWSFFPSLCEGKNPGGNSP